MTFDSYQYLVFFLFGASLFFALPHAWKKWFLFFLSILFYVSIKLEYGALLLFSIAVSYFCARFISYRASNHDYLLEQNISEETEKRHVNTNKVFWEDFKNKFFLWLSIFINIGILFFFKYANFFGENINALIRNFGLNLTEIPYVNIILPVGISFYTFQTIGYVVDVYQKRISAEKNFLTFALFVSFFPQLVAGPIERAGNLLPQLKKDFQFHFKNFEIGMTDVAIGFFKKIVISDNIAPYVNAVYENPEGYPPEAILLATYLFAVQIYCDFSGYSNIAIGTAKIFGIDLMKNFNKPYLAHSITEFWRRWHISLSRWIRDYLYIPLGGNRGGTAVTVRNLIIIMALAGLWHGASWAFVIWGLFHGFFLALERIYRTSSKDKKILLKGIWGKYLSVFLTFHLVCFSWIFFRVGSDALGVSALSDLEVLEKAMYLLEQSVVALLSSSFLFLFLVSNVILALHYIGQRDFFQKTVQEGNYIHKFSAWGAMFLLILFFAAEESEPFIYFQF